MRKTLTNLCSIGLLSSVALLVGCDWSSGSQDGNNFNLRGSASIANISGFYRGTLQGRAVAETSNGNINNFTIQQSGNRIEVIDNQGSRYVGSVGNPLLLVPEGSTTIPVGAEAATYQISFSGKDNVAARDIEFTGVITLVTVDDVVGSSTSNSNTQTNQDDTTTTTTSSSTSTISIPQQNGVDGIEPGIDETVTTTTTSTTGNTNSNSNTQTDSVSFELTDANTQLRLRGTWSEVGGVTSSVDALAAGIQGNIVVPDP